MRVVKAELIAAVVTHGHGHRAEVDDLHHMRMAAVASMGMVPSMDRGQGGPNDRVRAVRCHPACIGTLPSAA
jgi:hypothetical protein